MPADLADSLKADEEERKTDHAPLVAATENLRHGDLGVEVDRVKGDLAETENSHAGDKSSSEWDIVVEEVISTVDEEVFVAVRQHG